MALFLEQKKNTLGTLVNISDHHWICPGPEEIPDGEPWQSAVPAMDILHPPRALPALPAPVRGDTHAARGSSSLTVHSALKSRPCSDETLHRERLARED